MRTGFMMRCFVATQALWFALAGSAQAAAPSSSTAFLNNGVTAHRGNSIPFPENTIPAFRSAIEVGADWIELDIFRTSDGQLVVIHDRTTQRVSGRNLVVPESTYETLAKIDVADAFRRRMDKTVGECPPHRIPLLRDVLQLVMGQSRTRVSIQPKMDCVADALALVREMKAERWVGFNDGNLKYMAKVKRLAPNIPVFWDRDKDTNIEDDIRTAKEHGFEALVLHHEGVTAEKVARIQAAGLKAGAWTVDSPALMTQLLDMGVERLYTDDPRLLLAIRSARRFQPVACQGTYPHHLQGICADREAIYWSFSSRLVKTDLQGGVLKDVSVPYHHGDLCFADGRIYVAVNLGKFNDPAGHADSWVYVYRAEDLSLVSKHEVPQVVYGAGGIGIRSGQFFVVGGLPDGVEENYVYEYDPDFKFVGKHTLKSGHTALGIQTATFAGGQWFFGCYGEPRVLLVTDADFRMKGRYACDCALGIEGLADGRLLTARGQCHTGVGCTGKIEIAMADEKNGLRTLEKDGPAK